MPNPFPPYLQSTLIISLQSLLCNKQSFHTITLILLTSFHTLASLSITLTSNNFRHSLLLCVSHTLSFSFLLSLSWMGVNLQILFNPMPTLLHMPFIPFVVSHSRLSVLSRHPSQSRSVSAYCTALHGTARHCTARHSTAQHHKTPSPMLPLIPSNHPVNNPVMTNKDPTAIHTEIEGP